MCNRTTPVGRFFIIQLSSTDSSFLLFFQISFHIRLNLLEFRRELVEGVLLHHHFHLAQTVLITGHFGASLLGMDGTVTDFILAVIAQGITYALHDRTHRQVEEMLSLYI